jgi:hypothetical protein
VKAYGIDVDEYLKMACLLSSSQLIRSRDVKGADE